MFFLSLLASSCKTDKPDVSDIKVQLTIKRFEQDLAQLKATTPEEQDIEIQTLRKKYPYFYTDWVVNIMGFGHPDSAQTTRTVYYFARSRQGKELLRFVNNQYQNFEKTEQTLTQAYRYFKFYYPNENPPEIITFVSQFGMYWNPVGNNYTGIGLDLFLGDTFPAYRYVSPPFENYWFRYFNQEQLPVLHFMALAGNYAIPPGNDNGTKPMRFLDEMVYWGKHYFFIDKMLPDISDEIKFSHKKEDEQFFREEESNMWMFLTKEKYLFSTDIKNNSRFFKEAPYTNAPGVAEKTPALMGRWVGWQIVKAYMQNNPNVTLPQLMAETDADKILKFSKYKP